MAKYYVQSGSIRGVVDCYDAECAAVWAVNLVMLRSEKTLAADSAIADEDTGMFALDDTVSISEQGFDRNDCIEIDTHLAFVHWHQLRRAIDALTERMDEMLD